MASTEDLAPETPSGTTRRTVLKAAGHAAWMIPAVQIASQVPALAASGDGIAKASTGNSHTAWSESAQRATSTVTSTIVNNDTKPSTSLTVVLTMTAPKNTTFTSPTATVPSGWTGNSAGVLSAGDTIATWNWATTTPIDAGATKSLSTNMDIKKQADTGTLSITWSATINNQTKTASFGL